MYVSLDSYLTNREIVIVYTCGNISLQHEAETMRASLESASISVESKSRLRVWYLKTFRGYSLTMVKATPSVGPFGRIRTQRVWHLMKQEKSR